MKDPGHGSCFNMSFEQGNTSPNNQYKKTQTLKSSYYNFQHLCVTTKFEFVRLDTKHHLVDKVDLSNVCGTVLT